MKKRQIVIRRSLGFALCIVFAAGLWLPLIHKAFRFGHLSALQEKRILAERPRLDLSFSGLLRFPGEFDQYFRDNFGLRSLLVTCFGRIRGRIPGLTVGNEVLVGKKGWYFIKQFGTLDDYRGVLKLSQEELEQIKRTLEARRDWLAGFGIKYLPVIAPAKWAIYPEYVPSILNRVDDRSMLDQVLEYLGRNSDIQLLDLRKSLLEAKERHEVYYRNDTHWNSIGMFVAAREINKRLSRWFPNVKVDNLENYRVEESYEYKGDLAVMMGLHGRVQQKTYTLIDRNQNEVAFKNLVETRQRGHILTIEEQTTQEDHPKAVIFHDSFGKEIHPFLKVSFRRSVYFWKTILDTNMIIKERPDAVIHILAQRHILESLLQNPAGVVGDSTELSGKTAQLHSPPEFNIASFKAQALSTVPGEQYVSLYRNEKKIQEWQINAAERTFDADIQQQPRIEAIARYRFDYRYALGPISNERGTTLLPFDLDVETQARHCFVGINGGIMPHSRGYNVYRINSEGVVTLSRAFDVYRDKRQSANFSAFLESMRNPKGYLLLVSWNSAGRRLRDDAIRAMESLGLAGFSKDRKLMNHIALFDLDRKRIISDKFGSKRQVLNVGSYNRQAGFRIRQIRIQKGFSEESTQ
jgi:alginate O-acetyltransferase complex protein AlgJ